MHDTTQEQFGTDKTDELPPVWRQLWFILALFFTLVILAAMTIPLIRGYNDRQEIDKANVKNIALIKKSCPQSGKAVEYYNTTSKQNQANISDTSNKAALVATLGTRYC